MTIENNFRIGLHAILEVLRGLPLQIQELLNANDLIIKNQNSDIKECLEKINKKINNIDQTLNEKVSQILEDNKNKNNSEISEVS